MTHTPSIKKRRRRRRNEKWVRMHIARPLIEYYGRPIDDLQPSYMFGWPHSQIGCITVRQDLSIRMV